MRKNILMGLVMGLGLMMLGATAPAMADHDRRGGPGYHQHVHHHYHGKHHKAPKHVRKGHKAPKHHRRVVHHHHHRSAPPRRVVEHHYYYSEPRRYPDRRHYRGHTDIPLVTVGGYPAVRIQVNH